VSESSGNRARTALVRDLVGAEILVIDQDERVTRGMTQLLSGAGLHVTCVDHPSRGFELLARQFFSVVVLDLDTPAPNAGLDTIAGFRRVSPTSMLVVLTPRRSYDDAVAAIRAGAVDVILKTPESVQYLKERVLGAAGRSVGKRAVDSMLAEVRDAQSEFLKVFMESERRALDLGDKLAGRDPGTASDFEQIRVLVAEGQNIIADALRGQLPAGFVFQNALSGGQALDLIGSSRFHIVMISEDLADLPGSMVMRSVATQNPDAIVIAFTGPTPPGRVEIVETSRRIPVVDDFRDPSQLLERLGEIADAFRAKTRERRYTQAFRERHYDFLRRFVELKAKIDRALLVDDQADH
jgi:DNA-binding NtrC family response regulator